MANNSQKDNTPRPDYKALNERLRTFLVDNAKALLQTWIPNGKFEGADYVARNPVRTSDRKAGSFRVNWHTGKWLDHATTGDKGGDLIALYGYLHGIQYGQAAKELCSLYGLNAENYIERERPALDLAAITQKTDAEKAEKQAKCREKSALIWANAAPAMPKHPYLLAKKIKPNGTKQGENCLIVPVMDCDDVLHGVQYIYFDQKIGKFEKRFETGTAITGNFHVIGRTEALNEDSAVICEGFATGASIHEATSKTVFVAFNAGNLPAVAKAVQTHWEGVQIIIAGDNDVKPDQLNVGKDWANKAACAVNGVVVFPELGSKKCDWNDVFIELGQDKTRNQFEAALELANKENLIKTKRNEKEIESNTTKETESLSKKIIEYVSDNFELFHSADKNVYVQDSKTGEVFGIGDKLFEMAICHDFYKIHGRNINEKSLSEAVMTLKSTAVKTGIQHEPQIRVAEKNGTYYLDLAQDGNNKSVYINKNGWSIIQGNQMPIKFKRPPSMRPLPNPIKGGKFETLWAVLNVLPIDRLLILPWLIDCLRPDTPFPVLEIQGEQGSAKSTTHNFIRALIDPNKANLRSAPRNSEDVIVAAGANWFVSYENMSKMDSAMQDCLCVISTGGGFAKRENYTNSGEHIVEFKRPVILNGITGTITAQDLANRAVTIECPVIERTPQQKLRNEVDSLFAENHAYILGGLLDIMVKVLNELPNVDISSEKRPRLVEYALLGVAAARVMGYQDSDFIDRYDACQMDAIERAIDSSPVASAIFAWAKKDASAICGLNRPLSQIFDKISEYKPPYCADSWPRNVRAFGDVLRRDKPALRKMGIECKNLGKVGSTIRWHIQPTKDFFVQNSQEND